MATTIGNMGPYEKGMDISTYMERFEFYVQANEIDNAKKKAVFLSLVGCSTFNLIKDLLQPDKLDTHTYDDIVKKLKTHLEPQSSVIVQRYKFDKLTKGPEQLVSDFINEIKHLSEKCKFGTSLDERLRDKLVSGLCDDKLVTRLLSEGDSLTFDKAVDICLTLEQNRKDTQNLLRGETIHKIEKKGNYQKRSQPLHTERKKCYRCNGMTHKPEDCFFKSKACNACHKIGHKESACRSKNQRKQPVLKQVYKSTGEEEYQIMVLNSISSKNEAIIIDLTLNGVSGIKMEVDTGAAASVITESTWQNIQTENLQLKDTCPTLKDFSGNVIPTVGYVDIPVTYQEQAATLPTIVVKKGNCNLMGRDWLRHLRLDWKSIFKIQKGKSPDEDGQAHWEEEFPEVFEDKLGKYKGPKAHITQLPNTEPVFLRERSIPLAIRDKVKQAIESMVEDGILTQTSHSRWATPIVPVVKKDGSVRVCGDYRQTVNRHTACQSYPLPTLDNMLYKLAEGTKFSKLDLSQAYLQLSLDDETSEMCSLNTPFGLFRMNRLPYGVSSSPAIFQRTMENLLKEVKNVVVFIDDILAFGKNQEEHDDTVRQVLQKLSDAGLVLKKDKCKWNVDSVVFLGHEVSKEGIKPLQTKIEAIQKMRAPSNVSELKTMLGMVNYYNKFLPNAASVLEPLHYLLRKDVQWEWKAPQEKAFNAIKDLLSSSKVLTHFDPHKPLVLTVDASPHGIGAILSHREGEEENPIGYVSRSLNSAEKNYSQTELEALAVIFGILRFQKYLYGHQFTIETDHKPLIGLFGKGYATSKIAAGRITRWSIYLNQFNYELTYKPGKKIAHADTLSRFPVDEPPNEAPLPSETIHLIKQMEDSPVTFRMIAEETKKDKLLKDVMYFTRTCWPEEVSPTLKAFKDRVLELSIQEGCVMWGQRVVIPETLRRKVMEILHEGHIGITKMKALARSFVYWPKLDSEIEEMTKKCKSCIMTSSANAEIKGHTWLTPSKPWERVHMDFAEDFMGTNFLIVIDANSKWIEAYEQHRLTSESTIENLLRCFATYGFPRQVHTDNGRAFTSQTFCNFMKSRGINHTTSAAYSPKTNGLAERAVQVFKLRMRKSEGTRHEKLMDFLLHYRRTIQQTTGRSPAAMMFGRELRTKIDLVQPEPGLKSPSTCSRPWEEERSFTCGEPVLARDFVSGKGQRWRIGTVTARLGRFKYEVRVNGGYTVTRHADALKSIRSDIRDSADETDQPEEMAIANDPAQATKTPEVEESVDGPEGEAAAVPTNANYGPTTEFLGGAVTAGATSEPTATCVVAGSRRNPKRKCGAPFRYLHEQT